MDIPGSEEIYNDFCKEVDREVYPISSVTGQGLQKLLFTAFEFAK